MTSCQEMVQVFKSRARTGWFYWRKEDGGAGDNWSYKTCKEASQTVSTNKQLFTGRMPFLSPNQQYQSTKGWQGMECFNIWNVLIRHLTKYNTGSCSCYLLITLLTSLRMRSTISLWIVSASSFCHHHISMVHGIQLHNVSKNASRLFFLHNSVNNQAF